MLALRQHHVLADAALKRNRQCCAQTTPRSRRCALSDNVTCLQMLALRQYHALRRCCAPTTPRARPHTIPRALPMLRSDNAACLPSDDTTRSADVALRQRRVLNNARAQTTPRACLCALSDNATFSSTLPSDNAASSPTPRPDNARRCSPMLRSLSSENTTCSANAARIQRHVIADCAHTTPVDSKLYSNVQYVIVIRLANATD